MASTEDAGMKHGNQDSAAMTEPTRPFRLLDLPPELQLYIFELAVVQEKPIQIEFPCAESFPSDDYFERRDMWYAAWEEDWDCGGYMLRHPPPLSQTCRALRYDVTQIFYRCNTFETTYCEEPPLLCLFDWLERMGVENRRAMKQFFVYEGKHCPYGDRELEILKKGVAASGAQVHAVVVEEGKRFRVSFEASAGESA